MNRKKCCFPINRLSNQMVVAANPGRKWKAYSASDIQFKAIQAKHMQKKFTCHVTRWGTQEIKLRSQDYRIILFLLQ